MRSLTKRSTVVGAVLTLACASVARAYDAGTHGLITSGFCGVAPLASGTLRFDTDPTLQSCPAQPSSINQPVDPNHAQLIEQQEEAASLGIDPQ